MKFLTLVTILPVAVLSAQVNFYSDTTCLNYIGSSFVGLDQVVGGPADSFSMLFVNYDDLECLDTCGPNLIFCKNSQCNAWDVAPTTGVCKHFTGGVLAAASCGCEGCSTGCSGEF